MSRADDVSALLHRIADEQNDAHDHDEMHAAAEVTHLYGENEYVTRWIDGLLQRSHARRAQQAAEETGGPKPDYLEARGGRHE